MADSEVDTSTSCVQPVVSLKIILKVRTPDGMFMYFKIARATPLGKLMQKYCERYILELTNVIFRFNGRRVATTDTAASLNMEDGDIIQVYHTSRLQHI
ncbi:small ubiquitin-related modifier 2-A-like [Myzus persicae]|uniref:small ubiquitin-related modifier 2-A-like n=1 Tax=Myzus persicae TaxID=13164 RepID=UPI000B92F975|nr:small ubiquitin-related modifier 2-A-like [Myzus persicae]